MIKTLQIRGFKSFPSDRDTVIDVAQDNKPVALFYGLNGAGKSAIGQVVDQLGQQGVALQGCQIETNDQRPYRYLVYNQAFVERSFRNAEGFPGIFTIGEPQADALAQRERIEAQLPVLDRELESHIAELRALTEAGKRADDVLSRGIWASFQSVKDGPLKPFLPFGNSMARFVEKVRGLQTPSIEPASLDVLAEQSIELGNAAAAPKAPLRFDGAELQRLETDPVWAIPIEGSAASRLTPLIDRLKNHDWVRHGQAYTRHSDGQCPFCQQGLPADFESELHALFDATYQQRLAYMQSAARNYIEQAQRVGQSFEVIFSSEPYAADNAPLQAAVRNLRLALEANIAIARAKTASPTASEAMVSTQSAREAVEAALKTVNERIGAYNDRIARRADELKILEAELWQRLAFDAAPAIAVHGAEAGPRDARMMVLRGLRTTLEARSLALRRSLADLHAGTASIEPAVGAINAQLASFGMDGFSITKDTDHEHLYHLARPHQGRSEFVSLSEGEKTLITFLYFLELVKGNTEQTQPLPIQQTIVVVDDPISSLSHNHVYDIATLIARDLSPCSDQNPDGVRQLIVLTHSLFFFHELTHTAHKLHKRMVLKRVVKRDHSQVLDLAKDELGNDYEAFWQVVKDAQDAPVKPATLANTMRCILEHFFYFVASESEFKRVLGELAAESPGYQAFSRALDRGSHSDRTNITDFGEHDTAGYLDYFRRVFEKTGNLAHYQRRMGTAD